MDILIVVDMQNDFVSGALGTQEAFDIVPYVVGRVAEGAARGEEILFTRDTHGPDYMDTQEGRHLPVPHCIRGTEGWEIIPQLQPDTVGRTVIDKPTLRALQRPAGQGVFAGGGGRGGGGLLRRCHAGGPPHGPGGHEALPDHRKRGLKKAARSGGFFIPGEGRSP